MGHLTTRDAYKNLSDRINWFTQGAPASETLYFAGIIFGEGGEVGCAASCASVHSEKGCKDMADV